MKRLILVRHAPTAATKAAAFPLDERPDESALAAASRLGEFVPRHAEVCASPAVRCQETARAAGLEPVTVPELAECDFREWGGRTLADVCEEDPAGAEAWMTDPEARPHGGESLSGFAGRVAGWLETQAESDGSTFAVTHGGVVKAAIVSALGAPLLSFWRVDVAPLSLTELHAHDGRWTLVRTNVPLNHASDGGGFAVPPAIREELRAGGGAVA
ncbi:MAG TPA: histidine phosphatase family protein [Solirubrobacterales bacterium]|nr:histidine phosphatase family protein [Solirubrobacterales bacterium]